jgi:DNA-binding IclR family transcriptional regulator
LRNLVAEVKQIAHVGILDGDDVIYVLKEENERPVRLVSAVGKRLPAHATALGKILMQGLTDDEIRALYPTEALPRLTGNTLATREDLIAVVRESAKSGYCVDRGESTVGVTCFAAPLFDRDGRLVAALSVSVIDADPLRKLDGDYLEAVTRAAATISTRLGFRGVS